MSAEQQIASAFLSEDQLDLEMIRDAVSNIFYQYLSEKASPRVKCSENARKKIWSAIQGSSLSDTVFDEIQQQVCFSGFIYILYSDCHFAMLCRFESCRLFY